MQAINTPAVAAGGVEMLPTRAHMLQTEQIETETDARLQVIFFLFFAYEWANILLAESPIHRSTNRTSAQATNRLADNKQQIE